MWLCINKNLNKIANCCGKCVYLKKSFIWAILIYLPSFKLVCTNWCVYSRHERFATKSYFQRRTQYFIFGGHQRHNVSDWNTIVLCVVSFDPVVTFLLFTFWTTQSERCSVRMHSVSYGVDRLPSLSSRPVHISLIDPLFTPSVVAGSETGSPVEIWATFVMDETKVKTLCPHPNAYLFRNDVRSS